MKCPNCGANFSFKCQYCGHAEKRIFYIDVSKLRAQEVDPFIKGVKAVLGVQK